MRLTGITPVLNVSDVPASLAWFEGLGWKRCFTFNDGGMIDGAADADEHGRAAFAAVGAGAVEIFLCRDGQGARGAPLPDGPADGDDYGSVWMSWWLTTPAEVDAVHARALELELAVLWPPTDEPWGCREFRLGHPDGHVFRVSAPLAR